MPKGVYRLNFLLFSPLDMPTCYLFTVLSSVSLSGWSRYDNHETRLWLQMAMQVVLLIFSGLLFAFSRTKQNEAIQILLSLAEVFVIIYQVSCLLFKPAVLTIFKGNISIAILCYMSALVSMAFSGGLYTLLQHNTYAHRTSIHM